MGKKSKRRMRRSNSTPATGGGTTGTPPEQGAQAAITAGDGTNNNNIRPTLDRMMENFRLASSLYDHDVWNHERLSAFFNYSEMWEPQTWLHLEDVVLPLGMNEVDCKFVRKVRRHRTKPHILRAEALWLSGFMIFSSYHHRHLWDEAQDFFDEAVAVCRTISDEDKSRTLFIMEEPVKVSQRINIIRQRCKMFENLHQKFHFGAWSPIDRTDMDVKLVGGLECDYCKKDRYELDLDTLQVCSRCNMAYYCSSECQGKAWREGGHKQLCRKPGEFKPGDGVYITEAVELARIPEDMSKIEWQLDEQGQKVWEPEIIKTKQPGDTVTIVSLKESGEILIEDRAEESSFAMVEAKILRCCRPDLWKAFTKEDLECICQALVAEENKDHSSALVDSENEGPGVEPPELMARRPVKEREEGAEKVDEQVELAKESH